MRCPGKITHEDGREYQCELELEGWKFFDPANAFIPDHQGRACLFHTDDVVWAFDTHKSDTNVITGHAVRGVGKEPTTLDYMYFKYKGINPVPYPYAGTPKPRGRSKAAREVFG